ncbi:MAG: VIT1/CCC1 transporter family protein, partial [Candidatus Omnitrophica bacterium]|nr:VIT1/CCC1 transporter family protein [Candidatus Omnitrophota bacterium]
MRQLAGKDKKIIKGFQKNEITEYLVYKALSRLAKNGHNRAVLEKISKEELSHYHIWHKYTGEKVEPDNIRRWFYIIISAVFGVTFGIKLMEKGEEGAQVSYERFLAVVPEAKDIQVQENEHETELINMLDEDKLKYMGSVVLGLNDALVEFTGALAGFTFALQNSRLIAMVGLIMGFSASLSMAASEYLSTKTEDARRSPVKASIYTGMAYVVTVCCLIFPYFIFQNYFMGLAF